mmetsp:Transcript_49385/g.132147  ORF Transcript_49385/g.132147 Transcript_49385/m.132147 type:complete len:233 (-) Transcript_49385:86-784(-)
MAVPTSKMVRRRRNWGLLRIRTQVTKTLVSTGVSCFVLTGEVGGFDLKNSHVKMNSSTEAMACHVMILPMPWACGPPAKKPELALPTPCPTMGLKIAADSTGSRSPMLNQSSASVAGVLMKAGEASAHKSCPKVTTANASRRFRGLTKTSPIHLTTEPVAWKAAPINTARRRLPSRPASARETIQEPGRNMRVTVVVCAVIQSCVTSYRAAAPLLTAEKVSQQAWLVRPSSM